MAFGDRLQAVRKRNALTQEEFAEQLQVSRQAVSKWESGRSYPELDKVIYICSRYGTTMNELFADELPTENPDTPHETKALPRHTLGSALSGFYSNLSPYNKIIGLFLLGVFALLCPAYVYCIRSLKGGADYMMTIVWIAAIIVFGIAEAATAGLVSIWFVVGAVAALITVELGGSLWMQLVLFLIVSIAALVATRPLARRMLDHAITPTNADRVLAHTARVVEAVDNERSRGAVYIDGKTWTARSEDGALIPKDAMVTVVRMEGVKLFVTEKKED
ncbi:MAG: helix-turn-helix domain-containing protein [Deltaproteobacteria bacterium]|nr:helix-turn-helix domain-containing protein [Deltaproteobacteria bacterium]